MEGVRRFGGRLPGNACRCDAAVLRRPQVSPQGRPHLPPRPSDGQHGPQHRPELPYEVSWLGCEGDYVFPEAGGIRAAYGYLSGECGGVLGEVCGEEGESGVVVIVEVLVMLGILAKPMA